MDAHAACDLILFGTLGDLATRKLLPALYHLEKNHLLHADTHIIGVARQELHSDAYTNLVYDKLATYIQDTIEPDAWARLQKKLHYVQIDLNQPEHYQRLKTVLRTAAQPQVSYLAIPPTLYGQVCEGLSCINHNNAKIVVEKPIGHDLKSSQQINEQLARYYQEQQIYRIDHYLGKESVQNLLALRRDNPLFAQAWHRDAIKHIQITAFETLGVEGRWSYYDAAGQVRDMLQNHLLQILALLAMEIPERNDSDSIRDEKVKLLSALKPLDLKNDTIRAQYTSGRINNQDVPGYREEPGANSQSHTETFVALRAEIDNPRWRGVPFYLRTGKRIGKKVCEVTVQFRGQNKLTICLQDSSLKLQLADTNTCTFQQSDPSMHTQLKDPYQRLLLEIFKGSNALFVRRDEVELAWQWLDPMLRQENDSDLYTYPAGSFGPKEAEYLMLNLKNFESTEALEKSFTKEICNQLEQAIAKRGMAYLVASGGNTPKDLFAQLSQASLAWEKVVILPADERCVDPNHQESNERLIKSTLLQHQAAKVQFLSLYDPALEHKLAAIPTFDVVILGMGTDGHTASLFPCSHDLTQALETTKDFMTLMPQSAPYQRLSLTKKRLTDSHAIYLHLVGEKKMETLRQALEKKDPLIMPIYAFLADPQIDLHILFAPS